MTQPIAKEDVLALLKGRQGRDMAIMAGALANQLEQRSDVRVRQLIRELIKDGAPIAAAVDKPAGYFMATTWEEAGDYAANLRSRCIADAVRRRDFLRAFGRWFNRPVIQERLIDMPDKLLCSVCDADLVKKPMELGAEPVYVCLRPGCQKRGVEIKGAQEDK